MRAFQFQTCAFMRPAQPREVRHNIGTPAHRRMRVSLEINRKLDPHMRVEEMRHRDASQSTPVLKISPFMRAFPFSAPCQVFGRTA